MTFAYGLVSRGNVPLCQYCPEAGYFDLYYQKFIANNESEIGKICIYQYDNLSWGVLREPDNLMFVCVTHTDSDPSLISKLLEEIKTRFTRAHSGNWQSATTFSLQNDFEPQFEAVVNALCRPLTPLRATAPSEMTLDDDQTHLLPLIQSSSASQEAKVKRRNTIIFISIGVVITILLVLFLVYFFND